MRSAANPEAGPSVASCGTTDWTPAGRTADAWRKVGLVSLVRAIAVAADEAALNELHASRTVFQHDGSVCLLAGYVDRLRADAMGWCPAPVADGAYNMTVDKFSRLPDNRERQRRDNTTDCRCYFFSYLSFLGERNVPEGYWETIEGERVASRILQRHVRRHFRLSVLECRRHGFMTRYVWRLPQGSMTLLMPRDISGSERRRWLRRHVRDVDPTRPGERTRVQAIIDGQVGGNRHVSIDHMAGLPQPRNGPSPASSLLDGLANGEERTDLGRVVAEEKADAVDDQRPAIRALGADALRRLVLRIFSDLSEGCLDSSRVADEFNLSRATLSRFAGTRWQRRTSPTVPDLYRNTARLLVRDPDFILAARAAGVWPCVRRIANDGRQY